MNRLKIIALFSWAVVTAVLAVTVVQQRNELDELQEKQSWMEAERRERESRSEEASREAKRILDEVLKKAEATRRKDPDQAPEGKKPGADPGQRRRDPREAGESARKEKSP
jgi:hypothetical protein